MNYCVTGAEGFIGSRFMQRVPEAVVWPFNATRQLALGQVDIIVHLGALAGIPQCTADPIAAFTWNVTDTVQILELARQYDCKVIFASSAAAANPTNPYAASKASAEAWCMAYQASYGVLVSILRFANVYGEGSWEKTSCVAQMCKDALSRNEIIVHGDGGQQRDFVYVEDVIEAILHAPFGAHCSVRTEALHTVYTVAKILSELSGAEIVHGEKREHEALRPMDAWPKVPIPYTSLEEGLEETWRWFKQHS